MVHFVRLFSAAALVTVSSAAPMVRRDGSAIGSEIPVSAPNGIPMSDPPTATASSSSGWSSQAAPPPQAGYQNGASMNAPPPMMNDKTSSTMKMAESTSMKMAESSMAMASAATMASATMAASMPQMSYGSGSSSWGGSGGSGYDNCVQQCAASHPSMTWTPSATAATGSGGSGGGHSGSGATHTVIVAPSQGVLRYIPFSTNASVGDTVSFVWGAGPHTVTQSSALEVCNKTTAPGAFASGVQNKSFVFNQVINNTNPIWYYCGVPGHCQKGMFGGVNIGQADPTGSGSPMPSGSMSNGSMTSGSMPSSTSTSYMPLSSVMANLTSSNSDMSTLWGYTKTKTSGNAYASGWGMSTNCAGMNADAMMQTAQNVMYMQTLIAANPQAVQNGKFAVNDANSLMIPPDLQQAMASSTGNATSTSSPSGSSSGVAAAGAASSASSAIPTGAHGNGAGSVTSSSLVVGLVAIVATFLAL